MTQQALAIRSDSALTTTELTARDVFNIWLADQSGLTRTVHKAEVTTFLEWVGQRIEGGGDSSGQQWSRIFLPISNHFGIDRSSIV